MWINAPIIIIRRYVHLLLGGNNVSPKNIVVLDVSRIATKSALFTGSSRMDMYRMGSQWWDTAAWMHSVAVDELICRQRHHFQLGEVLVIAGLNRKPVTHIQLTRIMMCDIACLKETQFQQLGYLDKADYLERGYFGEAHGWFMEFAHITPQSHQGRVQ
jgi:hypothetical protein